MSKKLSVAPGSSDIYVHGRLFANVQGAAKKAADGAARIVACVNALEGYDPEAVRTILDGLTGAQTMEEYNAAVNALPGLRGAAVL